jgi:hypothetical protein
MAMWRGEAGRCVRAMVRRPPSVPLTPKGSDSLSGRGELLMPSVGHHAKLGLEHLGDEHSATSTDAPICISGTSERASGFAAMSNRGPER